MKTSGARSRGCDPATRRRALVSIHAFIVMLLGVSFAAESGELSPAPSAVNGAGQPVGTMRSLDDLGASWSQKLEDSNERFELVFSDNAVLDRETGLVWKRVVVNDAENLDGAVAECVGLLVVDGRRGWRVPTAPELMSLLVTDAADGEVAFSFNNEIVVGGVPQTLFSGVQGVLYWTSSRQPSSGAQYAVNLDTAGLSTFATGTQLQYWCVRAPE